LTRQALFKLWFLKERHLGPAQIGIFEPDTLYGWRHKPNTIGRQFTPFGLPARYTIDDFGNRTTPGSYLLPKVVFLGCSFTFGEGIGDDESYVWLLGQKWENYKFINSAVLGWSTIQASQKLDETLARFCDVELVVYGVIGHHERRNYPDSNWLNMLHRFGRKHPFVDLEGSELTWRGLTNPQNLPSTDSVELVEKGKQITARLLQKMEAACHARGIPFLVVYLPDESDYNLEPAILSVVDTCQFLDLRKTIPLSKYDNEIDEHPSVEGNQEMAHQIEPFLAKWLGQKHSATPPSGTRKAFF
ncbi:MAG: hypothetical protein AAB316_21200, partial [Bacteroidota bacterium]